jgi:hypothetical protein
MIYSLMVFFEKPYHCYQSTSFYTRENKTDNECDLGLQYLNSDIFMSDKLYRSLEIIFLVYFIVIKLLILKVKNIHLFHNINSYLVITYITLGLIIICLFDIIICLITDSFPLLNFFLRGIVIILLIEKQREMWRIVFRIFNRTKVLTFLIVCVMIFFGIIGYFLFGGKSNDFEDIFKSTYSLFILLSTCNFPDVMLGTFDYSNKFPFIYFLIYLAINYFILFTLLKTIYYSEFYESFKENARKAIESLFYEFHSENEEDENEDNRIYNEEKNDKNQNIIQSYDGVLKKVLINLSNKFYLTDEDFEKIIRILGKDEQLKDNFANWRNNLDIIIQVNQSALLRFLSNKYTEIVINIIDFVIMMLLLVEFEDYYYVLIPQFIWCLYFVFEFIVYKINYKFNYLFDKEFVLILFFIINCSILILILLEIISIKIGNEYVTHIIYNIIKVLIALRIIRVFILFNKYNKFETISKTFKNMKTLFYGLLGALFSFFYLFTTITMFLTGGKIRKDSFDHPDPDSPDEIFPREYVNINFNDFGSGFLSCFCLTMINNINIISRSLSFHSGDFFQGYFALFYFISTLVILNISTTLLLEMYMSIKTKVKEKNKTRAQTINENFFR